jgi:hypothetical protein
VEEASKRGLKAKVPQGSQRRATYKHNVPTTLGPDTQ